MIRNYFIGSLWTVMYRNLQNVEVLRFNKVWFLAFSLLRQYWCGLENSFWLEVIAFRVFSELYYYGKGVSSIFGCIFQKLIRFLVGNKEIEFLCWLNCMVAFERQDNEFNI